MNIYHQNLIAAFRKCKHLISKVSGNFLFFLDKTEAQFAKIHFCFYFRKQAWKSYWQEYQECLPHCCDPIWVFQMESLVKGTALPFWCWLKLHYLFPLCIIPCPQCHSHIQMRLGELPGHWDGCTSMRQTMEKQYISICLSHTVWRPHFVLLQVLKLETFNSCRIMKGFL